MYACAGLLLFLDCLIELDPAYAYFVEAPK